MITLHISQIMYAEGEPEEIAKFAWIYQAVAIQVAQQMKAKYDEMEIANRIREQLKNVQIHEIRNEEKPDGSDQHG